MESSQFEDRITVAIAQWVAILLKEKKGGLFQKDDPKQQLGNTIFKVTTMVAGQQMLDAICRSLGYSKSSKKLTSRLFVLMDESMPLDFVRSKFGTEFVDTILEEFPEISPTITESLW